jgi:cytochrome P450
MDTGTGAQTAAPSSAAPAAAAQSRVVTDPGQVRAILADPGYTVPDAGRGAPPGTMLWLRQTVSRFSEGADHARRRSLAEDLLRSVEPALLRVRAREATNAVIDAAGAAPFDVMALVARRVPGLVLAAALGAADPEQVIGHLSPLAAAYSPAMDDPAPADGSVTLLTELLPGGPGEEVAARIALLIQAYDATAGLIGNAVAAGMRAAGPGTAAALVQQILRRDPPVRVTRRVSPAGEIVTLDLAAAGDDPAGHLQFGSGPRPCPGAAHACALAEGAVAAVLERCSRAGAEITYPPPPALHAPERLEVLRVPGVGILPD